MNTSKFYINNQMIHIDSLKGLARFQNVTILDQSDSDSRVTKSDFCINSIPFSALHIEN